MRRKCPHVRVLGREATIGRRWQAWARLLCGAAVLVVLVVRLGTEPFVAALHAVGPATLAVAAGIAVVTTLCCAWRWQLVARGLGVELTLAAAMAAYYRSQLLNLLLPGGIVGDVHRGVVSGRDQGGLVRGLRAVAWERTAGQAVQVVLTAGLLLAVPSPLRPHGATLLAGGAVLLGGVLGVVLGVGLVRHRGWPALAVSRLQRALAGDLRRAVLAPGVWPGVVAASTAAVAGHLVTFCVAAHAAGVRASYSVILPVGALVLLVAAVPAHIAGWGPREGAAAWSFGVVGLEPALGVTVAAVYGLMALAAVLPGAVVLIGSPRRSDRTRLETSDSG